MVTAPDAAPDAPAVDALAAPEVLSESAAPVPEAGAVAPSPAKTAPRKPRAAKNAPVADAPVDETPDAEGRVHLVLKTSRLKDAAGLQLQRGRLVRAMALHADMLIADGLARAPTASEIPGLSQRWPVVALPAPTA